MPKMQEQVYQESLQKQPSIEIIGCGGLGVNIVKRLLHNKTTLDMKVEHTVIDTSASNFNNLTGACNIYSISDLGSGKDRTLNVDSIMKYLDNNRSLVEEAKDITFLVFSLAGGSGSVIGPLLAHRLLRHSSRAVVLVGVVDTSSRRDCRNSVMTLKSLTKIATESNYYIPIMLYSNVNVGRVAVNETITTRLIDVITMLTSPSIVEIDFMDKINYLRPTHTKEQDGVYLLMIDSNDPEAAISLPGEVTIVRGVGDHVHSSMVVNANGNCPRLLTEVTYIGISDRLKFYSTIGESIPACIINDLNETMERYNRNTINTSTLYDLCGEGKEGSSGLVL